LNDEPNGIPNIMDAPLENNPYDGTDSEDSADYYDPVHPSHHGHRIQEYSDSDSEYSDSDISSLGLSNRIPNILPITNDRGTSPDRGAGFMINTQDQGTNPHFPNLVYGQHHDLQLSDINVQNINQFHQFLISINKGNLFNPHDFSDIRTRRNAIINDNTLKQFFIQFLIRPNY